MAFDPYNPWLNFGINMLAANAPSRDPRSSSLGWAMAHGLGGMQDAGRAKEEMENRRTYAALQQQRLLEAQQESAKQREQERALSQTLAGMFAPPQEEIGRTNNIPGLPPGPATMPIMAPANAEQQRAQAMQRIQQLAQTDPDAAMKMLNAVNSGAFPGMPALPEPPKPPQPPGYFQHLDPEERELAAEYLGGLRARPLAARPAAAAGGGGEAPVAGPAGAKPLTRAEWNKRISIERARASIRKLGVDRAAAEQMAKTDAGFKAALDLANQKMPGEDPAWETTMTRRATEAKKAPGGKSAAQLQAELDAITDPGLRKLKIESARRKGIVLRDTVQRRSLFGR